MNLQDLRLAPRTDPTLIYRYRDGLYAVDLLTTAIAWLDFFTWLSENPSDLEGICNSLQIKTRPTDVMLTLFAAIGLVRRDDQVFTVTDLDRQHLVRGSR